ncbi:MAG: hypothetical protein JM58_09140 [Peptococcaceae bacterium BICA1-8]|nr:MAG: hypothetical protein JM58_09140 [Peptococcaceae bacterium BICA1-8]
MKCMGKFYQPECSESVSNCSDINQTSCKVIANEKGPCNCELKVSCSPERQACFASKGRLDCRLYHATWKERLDHAN